MYFILSLAKVVVVDRIPEVHYEMVMFLLKACRLIFCPSGLSRKNVTTIKILLEKLLSSFYANIFRRDPARLNLCHLPIATLLDVVPGILACGPVWVSWQFRIERAIGTRTPMFTSRSGIHAALTHAIF